MKRFNIIAALAVLFFANAYGADPTDTKYSPAECQGSYRPYPTPTQMTAVPDSLTPVFINHVGRHGARYPSSAKNALTLRQALRRADSTGTITSLGRELQKITDHVIAVSDGKWGALDSLGMAEQRGIASRMVMGYPDIFADGGTITALSSYSPRAMMSMYSFTHQMDRLNNKFEFTTTTGRKNSYLMRPFDTDKDYLEFRKSEEWKPAYDNMVASTCPTTAIRRVLGENYPFSNKKEEQDLAMTEYYVVAALSAMGISYDALKLFTSEEYNALWSCFNMRQYLQRTATTISSVPASIAGPLILDLISTTDAVIEGTSSDIAYLRFGHAETIMPLASLLRLQGCYYLTNYFDTVAMHWRNFEVVPMASNIQFIIFKTDNGHYYVRTDLNERPVRLIPNDSRIYIPWGEAREYMMRCVPIYMQ
ncbi:MAG: hypothetical protein K2O12_05845 [Muribaculaceae bacterium]|nr:hypothetical protein [Muribaculaceae bacterium]